MSNPVSDRYRLAFLGWVATAAMAFAFLPTLSQKSFWFTAVFLSGLMVLLGAGLRWARTPAVVVLLTQVVVLAELSFIGFGHKLKYGLIPTHQTFNLLRTSVDSAMDVAQKYAAPAPPDSGLTMMVVVYIALIAVLVDFLAVTVHRVPLAGLPLLALYTVPVAALPHGVSFLLFVPGAIGFIALLMVDERDRLAHWGRLVARGSTADASTTIDTSGLTATGRRISVLALTSAVALPIFIPTFGATFFTNGNGDGPGSGSDLSFSDPMVSLANNLRRKAPVDILRVSGDIRPRYLRLAVLDQPGPNAWATQPINLSDTLPVSNILPRPTGQSDAVSTTPHTMNITATGDFPTDSSWLPVPFDSRFVAVGNVWSYVPSDQTVTATTKTAAALLPSYDVSYSSVDPTPELLRAAGSAPVDIKDRYTVVPTGVPQVVEDLAKSITAGATSHYDQAVLLQAWFRNRSQFTYSLDAAYGYGYQAMAAFLDKRRGFCQHFSATMAMMARELDIPSRVAVGFLQPDHIDGDSWVITSHDVHSWTELYFEGAGWVRFEPTPGVGAPVPSWAQLPDPGSTTTSNTLPSGTAIEDTSKPTSSADTSTAGAGAGKSSGGNAGPPSRYWLAAVLLLALALLPAMIRLGVRRNRMTRPIDGSVAAESAWAELRDHVRDLHMPWSGSMTPRARERAVIPMLDGDVAGAAALRRLTASVERARYAASPMAGATPANDAKEVMAVISRAAERGQRIRAFLWPSSLLPDLRIGWEKVRERFAREEPLDQ
ncbi:MAG: DUF3488 and transglutaminase-like domain-containing protein [Nocardioidaceae bacterium]